MAPTVFGSLGDVLTFNWRVGMPTGMDGQTRLEFPAHFEPAVQVGLNGFGDDFGADFSAFPAVKVQQQLWDASATYAGEIVDALYASDADVAADGQLQTWGTAVRDEGASTGALAPDVATKSGLSSLVAYMTYTTLAHAWSNLPAINVRGYDALNMPGGVMSNALPEYSYSYTEADVERDVLPSTFLMRCIAIFWGNFMRNPVAVPLIVDGDPSKTPVDHPIIPGLPEDHAIHLAAQALRVAQADLIKATRDAYNEKFCHSTSADKAECDAETLSRISRDTSW